jgi:hypothetical protein
MIFQSISRNAIYCSSRCYYHGLALSSDGKIISFGSNSAGQFGDGSTIARLNPVYANMTAFGDKKVVTIASGCYSYTSYAITRFFIFNFSINFKVTVCCIPTLTSTPMPTPTPTQQPLFTCYGISASNSSVCSGNQGIMNQARKWCLSITR